MSTNMKPKMRAIDLYSGVGGWSLGLRLAGIDVVASYEQWGAANETNFKNNHHQAQTVDIRRLAFKELPKKIDVVVGSPPCTQFSYSNRGGSGDLDDGLEDIIRFLSIVDYLKPKAWAMENVPRVAGIIEGELKKGGRLHRFAHLGLEPHLVNMEEFGLPQRRKRCIAGNFNFKLLNTYKAVTETKTLGFVVQSLSSSPVVDPIYGVTIPPAELWDHDTEVPLNEEEVRINRAAKVSHSVYNSMPFPDQFHRSVRTITATCTRVSRESVIIKIPNSNDLYRRLTIRERASLQGFPTTFQFYGSSYSQKLRMVGNAVPPVFSFLLAQAFKGVSAGKLPSLQNKSKLLIPPVSQPPHTRVDRPGARYPLNRRFRFAIPSLRLKSGVRFDLANYFEDGSAFWEVAFWFGTSKSIQSLTLDDSLVRQLSKEMSPQQRKAVTPPLKSLIEFVRTADVANMQNVWCHRGPGRTRAFMLLDAISEIGEQITTAFRAEGDLAKKLVARAICNQYGKNSAGLSGLPKLGRNAELIAAGLLCGSVVNIELRKHAPIKRPHERSLKHKA